MLHFDSNCLQQVPKEIFELPRLRVLTLSQNKLHWLPTVAADMPSLEELDISQNRLQRLNSDMKHFLNLKKLNLFRNRMDALPFEIFMCLPRLEEIVLEWFEFSDPPLPRKFQSSNSLFGEVLKVI